MEKPFTTGAPKDIYIYIVHSAVVDFGCVSSKIIWTKFKFSKVKVCVVAGYSPNEGDGKEGIGSGMTWTGLYIA